jgi:hypothetical protein
MEAFIHFVQSNFTDLSDLGVVASAISLAR